MRAIRLHTFGPAENLRYEEIDDPRPEIGQVRIAVAASGIHLIDTTIRSGVQGGPFPLPELPMVPGREVAGVVDELGPDVDPGWLGRRVVAHLGQASGGYAELALCEAEFLHVLPDGLTEEVAVAMIGTGRTTMGILDVAQLNADDVVLVTAAASGIGNLLVQEARNVGATVVGAAGGVSKVEQVIRLGATAAVDYTKPDWTEAVRKTLDGQDVTVALDGVGGERGRDAFELLGVGGRLVLFGWASGEPTRLSTTDLYARGLTVSVAIGPRMLQRPGGLRGLEQRALAATDRLHPLVGQSFPLGQAGEAHRAVETRATVGKTILKP